MKNGIWEWLVSVLTSTLKELKITVTERFSWTGGERTMTTPPDTLILYRSVFTNRSTIGEIYLDGEKQCYALEPTCRDHQDPSIPIAIPTGKYEVVMWDSPHFKRRVPLLLKVPGRSAIEIHAGNKPEDTHGCLIVGLGHSTDWVSDSVKALEALIVKIDEKLVKGKVYIGITGGEPKV